MTYGKMERKLQKAINCRGKLVCLKINGVNNRFCYYKTFRFVVIGRNSGQFSPFLKKNLKSVLVFTTDISNFCVLGIILIPSSNSCL